MKQNSTLPSSIPNFDQVVATTVEESDSGFTDMNEKPVGERLQRSRERNRIHARKTRQRKKEQMQNLTNRADELKQEQIRLKQSINEKNTASILLGLGTSTDHGGDNQVDDPRVEALLRRPAEEIPDAAKLPELPALILPGQHHSKKHKTCDVISSKDDLPDDGIDYELLGKDRSKCTPEELDQIRRERNRMHAKRTRDRKRLFMEEMAEMCKQLEDENELLQEHLDGLNGYPKKRDNCTSTIISPSLSSAQPELAPSELTMLTRNTTKRTDVDTPNNESTSQHGVIFDQLKTLLEAASTFSSAVSASTNSSEGEASDYGGNHSPYKRRRLHNVQETSSSIVPKSITTTTRTPIGC